MCAFGLVEQQRAGHGVEHLARDLDIAPLLEPRVPGHADPSDIASIHSIRTVGRMTRKTDDDMSWLVEINDALAAGLVGSDPVEWVYGYVRISRDDKDGAEGVRLQAKHEVAYAERKGLRLARIFCDNDMSGADPDRPALRELLELVTAGPAKVVLARDVARLTRDYDLGNELMKLGRDEGVRFVFMKDHDYDLTTGAGRKNFTVKVAEAAEYREVNTENLLDRMTEEAEKGVMQGGSRRFGYGKVVGTHPITGAEILDRCALRPEEVAVLREGRDRVINGESQTAIISDWNARGITTSGGARWRVGKLAQQLLLEAYVIYDLGEHTDATGARCACLDNPEGNGIRVHARTGSRHRAQWPGIFTRTEHEAMRAALIAHRSGKEPERPRQRNGEYWLTGLAECGGTWKAGSERAGEYCGGWLVGSLIERERKHGTIVQRRYGCQAADSARVRCGCGRVFRDAGALEMYVAQAVIAEYENPEILARLDRGNDNAARIAELQQRIETTTGNLDAETDRRTEVLTGARDADDLRVIERTIAGLKQTLKDLRSEQNSLRSTQALAVLADIGSTPGELRKAWDKKGSRWRHEAAARLIEKVIVKPARVYAAKWEDQNGKVWRFDESSVEILWRDLG
ncbi:DNA invertase Pin-like site-specific DNA recombinase [Nocardia kruczakiae]|uniref:DNA invertase Pin-like site-specific DNA recombinase n=1 Tax=Nocardia kruczakiae TaxID=261477 RepID=A0ABU1XRQ0_9NOCA|nr:recombinase family protein [Nocardia kruczakiae]MDR7172706.1 DNA invertase Pin-like site-specific DNA recombinase [Nocardia kruczakiae]